MTGFGKGGKGTILYYRAAITVGALNVGEVISSAAYALEEDFRILRMECWARMHSLTAGQEEALLILGLADAELSDAEIAEAINAEPVDRNDNVPMERSHRPVWPLGELKVLSGDVNNGATWRELADDHVTWTQRWTFSDTDGFEMFLLNAGGEALTTGSTVQFFAKIYGVWVK